MSFALTNDQRSFYYPDTTGANMTRNYLRRHITSRHALAAPGFTLIELVVVIAIIAILAVVAVPAIMDWLPNYRLKRASSELYSNIGFARMRAIRSGGDCAVVFNPGAGTYQIVNGGPDRDFSTAGDNVTERTIRFADYGSGVGYGSGNAGGVNWAGDAIPGDGVSHAGNQVVFNSRGMSGAGSVYLDHQEHTRCYAVTTIMSGSVRLRKWNAGTWD
ncbi:MAG: GspH/FimT family pseudopilin [Deltaproteobacteria bacterium]|nr:GspH/FimT family pseudopilin [Deltaproteobacteria bacterium]